jgi:hypothetical protein
MEPWLGFLVAFLLSMLAYAIYKVSFDAMSPTVGIQALALTFGTFGEQILKGLVMIFVGLFVWRTVPNCRYGAALGAVSGLGWHFALMIYRVATGFPADLILATVVTIPFYGTLFSSFVGLGVFVFAARKATGKSIVEALVWLPLLFLLVGVAADTLFDGITMIPGWDLWPQVAVQIFVFSPAFLILLRDFIGGHFNFLHFFEPLPESPESVPGMLPPPPEPPPP